MCISLVLIVCVILLETWKYSFPLSTLSLQVVGSGGGGSSLCSKTTWNWHSWFCRTGTAIYHSCVVHGTAKCRGCSPRMRCEGEAGCPWCRSSVWQPAGYQPLLWHKAVPRAQSLSCKRDAFTQSTMFMIYSVTSLLLTSPTSVLFT